MHELSLIANLFEILEKNAEEKKSKKITYVKMQVGILSGAVPELLISAFDIYKKDTIAADAKIEIVKVPLKVECGDCGQITVHDDYLLACSACGSSNLKTLSGTDMILERMELEIE